jgi:protein phosphatase
MVLIILYMHYCCQKMKWELVDMGNHNGTFLNSRLIYHPNSESRHWADPIELTSGDIITLGMTS